MTEQTTDDLLETMDAADAVIDEWVDSVLNSAKSVILNELDEQLVTAAVPPHLPLTIVQEGVVRSVLRTRWADNKDKAVSDLIVRLAPIWPAMMRHGLTRDYEEIAERRYREIAGDLDYEAELAADEDAERRGIPRGRRLFHIPFNPFSIFRQ